MFCKLQVAKYKKKLDRFLQFYLDGYGIMVKKETTKNNRANKKYMYTKTQVDVKVLEVFALSRVMLISCFRTFTRIV
jgi:hypothetical protein